MYSPKGPAAACLPWVSRRCRVARRRPRCTGATSRPGRIGLDLPVGCKVYRRVNRPLIQSRLGGKNMDQRSTLTTPSDGKCPVMAVRHTSNGKHPIRRNCTAIRVTPHALGGFDVTQEEAPARGTEAATLLAFRAGQSSDPPPGFTVGGGIASGPCSWCVIRRVLSTSPHTRTRVGPGPTATADHPTRACTTQRVAQPHTGARVHPPTP